MTWVVLGCGHVGSALAADRVAAGDDVVVSRRDAPALAALVARLGPLARAAPLELADADAVARAIPPGAIVVHAAPPAGPDGAVEAGVARAAADAGARRLIYVSSTGVYAPGGGAVVDETWPTEPAGASGRARLAAERALQSAAASASLSLAIVRAPGIYGPGRGVAARLRAGTYRVVGDGRAHVSRIHVDDLVAAIVALGAAARLAHDVYNVGDRDPCTAAAHADGAAALLGLPPPPRVPATDVAADTAAMLLADRRIDASRLERELGWSPRYPSWRDALLAELREAPASHDQ
jgi:nucleoside-diphosphate-sugar epimerase